ncbi:MAG: molybdopterin-dependent oxidoreductase, partial [Actinomycetota bacterium]|nr:molybdopterin-dependent oxidoreductase [Actinomycetota bacterium]
IGSLIIHIGAKLAITRLALSPRSPDLAVPRDTDHLGRRGFLGALAATSLALVVTTAGETFRPLRRLGILAPRDPDVGSQGIPVNRPAIEAAVVALARDPAYRLTVDGKVGKPLSLSLDDLRAMAQNQATLPISCVEGWSASATWRGVRVRDLLAAAGASDEASVVVESLEPRGVYRTSNLNHLQAGDADTLLALELDGQVLNLDHGYPVRLIAPNRPGVLQTKWVSRLAVT